MNAGKRLRLISCSPQICKVRGYYSMLELDIFITLNMSRKLIRYVRSFYDRIVEINQAFKVVTGTADINSNDMSV